MSNTTPPEEALRLLQQALGVADEALSLVASLEQLQDRFEDSVLPLLSEAGIWEATLASRKGAKQALFQARGCLDEMLHQVAQAQVPDMQIRAWADQLVELNEKLQASLASAGQQVAKSYELLRPTLVAQYLEHATRSPRWAETWPFDVEEAGKALDRISTGQEVGPVEELDIQLARFRWDVGWPQQRMAQVVGLSQPSVAARLGRMEAWISLAVASSHVRDLANAEDYQVVRTSILAGRGSRGPVGEFALEKEACRVELRLLVAAGETGAARRSVGADRSYSLDFLRWEISRERPRLSRCVVDGIALYLRDRGVVIFYTADQVAGAAGRLRGSTPEAVLQHLITASDPARTLEGLVRNWKNENHEEA